MWTMIKNSNLERYFQQHYQLTPFYNDLSLYANSEYTFFPRYFINNFPSQMLILHRDRQWIPVSNLPLELSSNFSLRADQEPVHERLVRLINSDFNGGIIKARPGFGKTVVSVAISCATRRKTLIILDNTKLVEQWIEAIKEFALYNGQKLTDDDIGIIQGDNFTTTRDTPFSIAMVQTLVSKVKRNMREYYTKMRDQGFDLIYFDECHKTTCGPKFATASLLLNTKNSIGLSATPFADNISKVLMENSIGKIVAEESTYDLKPTINYVLYDSGLSQKYTKFVRQAQDMLRQRSRYISILSKSEKYKQLMIDLVRGLLTDGHTIIIIVFTVELVKKISEWLGQVGIESRQFYSKQTELDKENDRVVVATYGYAGAGFDYKALSAAIIGTPLTGRKSLIQVIGRILRQLDGKENPVVYDFIDTGFGGTFTKDLGRKTKLLDSEFDCKFNNVHM